MTASETLTHYLKHLRERAGLSVKELAEQCQVNMSFLYKAEMPGKSVRITSLWEAYGPLCRTDEEWEGLLLRWAVASDPKGALSLYKGKESISSLREELEGDARDRMGRISGSLERVSDADFPLLESFIREFAGNEHARVMVRAWVEAVASSKP